MPVRIITSDASCCVTCQTSYPGRPCRARAKRSSELTTSPCLLVCLHDQVTTSNTPSAHIAATTTPCPQPIFLYRPSSTIWLVLVASTRRLSTQRAGTRGFTSSHATPRDLTRAQARTHHAFVHRSLHNTTTTLEHPPPPALLLLTAPPLPLDYRCLALLEHCTVTNPPPPPTNTTPSHPNCLPS